MDKIPLREKIISWIVSLIFILISCRFFILAAKSHNRIDVTFNFIIASFLLLVPSILLSILLSHYLGCRIASKIYWPGDDVKLLPPEYSSIRADIINGDYYKAIDSLEEMLEENPGNDIAVALLSDIFVDEINAYGKAIKLLSDYLNRQERTEKDVPFVLKLTDILIDMEEQEKAIRLLKKESDMKYDTKSIEILKRRLEGLT